MSSLNTSSDIMEIEEIIKALPHRYPFLMIDRVLKIDKKHITAIKNVSANEQYFVGHFVNEKIMPGVLIIEAMAQASAIKTMKSYNLIGSSFYLLSINKAKFRHPVKPGDTLLIKAFEKRLSGNRIIFECEACVKDTVVANAEILAVFKKEPANTLS